MEKNSELYNLTQAAVSYLFQAAAQNYQQKLSEEEQQQAQAAVPQLFQIRSGYAESPAWMMVQVMEFAPEPLTVEHFRKRAVYSGPELSRGLLELLASEGWLDRKGHQYFLTDAGRKIVDWFNERRTARLAGFEPLAADEIETIVNLGGRIIDACLQADTPPGTWCIAHSRNRAPADDAPPLAKIVQYASDFNSFRDDAHMAAYGAHNVQGHVWEAFNYVVTEQANTVAALYNKLAYRGFYTEDWQAAFNDLQARDWIVVDNGAYQILEAGRAVFEDVERMTDTYFYVPWAVLSEVEYKQFVTLLQKLKDRSQKLVSQ